MALLPSAQDELLRLTGSTGTVYETVSATGENTGAYYGAERLFTFQLVIAGTVAGTNPTLDVKFQDSADGVTYANAGYAFAQQTATMASATGPISAFPTVAVRTAVGRPYLRIYKTIGGTDSPSFGSVGVFLVADPSGVA